MKRNPFLYVVLLDKRLVPKPKIGDEILYYEYAGEEFRPSFSITFQPSDFHLKRKGFIPEMKDSRFMLGFGYTMYSDDLESFIELAEGKANRIFHFFQSTVFLKHMAALFGSERIWVWLELKAFGGRNLAIIKEVLKSTKEELEILLCYALNVFNFEVFAYLIESNDVESYDFDGTSSLRFLRKVKFPLFLSDCWGREAIDYITWYYVDAGLL